MRSRLFSMMFRIVLVMAFAFAAVPATRARASGTRYYARPNGAISGDCLTWATACKLHYMLSTLTFAAGDQIWVAAGVYTPNPGLQSYTLSIPDGVAVYGGFAGGETSLSQRKISTNVTVLSGDIGTVGDPSDNSDVVVFFSGVGSGTILDGFTITGGDGGSLDDGAGINIIGSSATLRNLIIEDNHNTAWGGGVYNLGGSPHLKKVTFLDNSAAQGGGMYIGSGSPTLENVKFIGNRAVTGGGLADTSPTGAVLTKVTFSNNTASSGGGGMNSANSVLNSVRFVSNVSPNGGGMHINSGGAVKASKTAFAFNTSTGDGGGLSDEGGDITLTSSTFLSNTADNRGGGLYVAGGTAKINKAVLRGNYGSTGGGIYGDALSNTSFIGNSTFDSNRAQTAGGAAIKNTTAALFNSTFSGNSAAVQGGGLYMSGASLVVANSTFNANHALIGAGVYTYNGGLPGLHFVTISGNTGSTGNGVMVDDNGWLQVADSIVWGNGASEFGVGVTGVTVSPSDSVIKGGCPALTGVSCGGTILSTSPKLGPLANNGGFTKTMALLAGSSAIDKLPAACGWSTDQRGIHRPQGPKCDMGAYEYVP